MSFFSAKIYATLFMTKSHEKASNSKRIFLAEKGHLEFLSNVKKQIINKGNKIHITRAPKNINTNLWLHSIIFQYLVAFFM